MTNISLKDLNNSDRLIELTDAELEKIRGGISSTSSEAVSQSLTAEQIVLRIIGSRGGGGSATS